MGRAGLCGDLKADVGLGGGHRCEEAACSAGKEGEWSRAAQAPGQRVSVADGPRARRVEGLAGDGAEDTGDRAARL